VASVLLILFLAAETAAQSLGQDAEYKKAISTILCDCGCHPQSTKDCACGRAAKMRQEIAQRMATGGPDGTPLDAEGVIALYVEEHGESIRIAPLARGFNLVAWLGPLAGLVGASLILLWLLRRWSTQAAAAQPDGPAPSIPVPDVDNEYHERVRRAVERYR